MENTKTFLLVEWNVNPLLLLHAGTIWLLAPSARNFCVKEMQNKYKLELVERKTRSGNYVYNWEFFGPSGNLVCKSGDYKNKDECYYDAEMLLREFSYPYDYEFKGAKTREERFPGINVSTK